MRILTRHRYLSTLSVMSLGAALALTACGVDEPTEDVGSDTSEVIGTAFSVNVAGRTRTYAVNRPATCTANCPVIVDIHGFTSTNTGEQNASGIFELANQEGIITVWPQGLNNSWNAGSGRFGSCCGQSLSGNVDDVGFMRAMIAKVKVDFPQVDPKRVYATGISNGCALSQRIATQASDVFAAVACSSLYLLTPETTLARPISVTEIHGRQDTTVSYNQSRSWTGAQNNFRRWATLNSCVGSPVRTNLTANSFVERFTNCAAGTQVTLFSIRSGHITYNNSDGIDVAQITWDNLRNVRLP
jgi:polyhydroxybutyrate depolymerase